MTRRDLGWRAAGVAMIILGWSASLGARSDAAGMEVLGLLGFSLAMAGLVLAVQGRRVAAALRVERSRHRDLPMRIRSHRMRRP
ncbi:hypothetical protein TPR58_13615 [Sphingomonas sp. HF-S3]|jgi:hypothetical protein|uniref:Uncharacterized protein n=1 Tax=Sphingomonas rustica TaxID=3103142 RepID=A0ABV0B9F4_9SPHN